MDVMNKFGSLTGHTEQLRIRKLRIIVLMPGPHGCTFMVLQAKSIKSSNIKRDTLETSITRKS